MRFYLHPTLPCIARKLITLVWQQKINVSFKGLRDCQDLHYSPLISLKSIIICWNFTYRHTCYTKHYWKIDYRHDMANFHWKLLQFLLLQRIIRSCDERLWKQSWTWQCLLHLNEMFTSQLRSLQCITSFKVRFLFLLLSQMLLSPLNRNNLYLIFLYYIYTQ